MSVDPKDLRGEALARFETWKSLGLSEASAMDQLRRDGLLPARDGFEAMVEVFKTLGLSESAARTAAIGREGSELSARRGFTSMIHGGRLAS